MRRTPSAVTIVVPVYSDWPSLEYCLISLADHVASHHCILLINDCGPEADDLERRIMHLTEGDPRFRYERNATNLGFVGTCNRAAEIDGTDNDLLFLNSDTVVTSGFLEEMLTVLYCYERHGCVCPRSNSASIASVPFMPLWPDEPKDPAEAFEVYQQIRDLLPRFHVAPVAVGFCILIRRELVANFGLFDPMFGLGYSEENDFCSRINRYGFSSIISNWSFVFHLEGRSFTEDQRSRLVETNEQKMVQRHRYYTALVQRYRDQYVDPVDWFADAVANRSEKRKLLIDLYHFPLAMNGTVRVALSFLQYLACHADEHGLEVTIVAQSDAQKFYKFDQFGFRVQTPEEIDDIFDIGFCPSQIFHLPNLFLLNRCCLKVVVLHQDMIAVRSHEHLAIDFAIRTTFKDTCLVADKVVVYTEATAEDLRQYYGDLIEGFDRFVPIHLGHPTSTFDNMTRTGLASEARSKVGRFAAEGPFVLLLGNDYPHKLMSEVLRELERTDLRVVVLGSKRAQHHSSAILVLKSGDQPESLLEYLFEHASVIVFPSMYEGFGLPVSEAARFGKPLVTFESDVTREVTALFPDLVVESFNELREVVPLVEKLLAVHGVEGWRTGGTAIRTMDDFSADVVDLLVETARDPACDTAHLRKRWNYLNSVKDYAGAVTTPARQSALKVRAIVYMKRNHPGAYERARRTYRRLARR